jgi:hypothetical protein
MPDHVERLLALAPAVPVMLLVGATGAASWQRLQPRLTILLRRPLIAEVVDTIRRLLPPSPP